MPQQLEQPRMRFDTTAQMRAVVIVALFSAVFYNIYLELQYKWLHDGNWSHGWIIPLFSLWFIKQNWERISSTPVRWAWLGLPLLLAGLAGYFWMLLTARAGYPRSMCMMISLLGVIILFAGVLSLRHLWVPWAFLFFAIPLPGRMYFALTDPLRRLAATVASAVLSVMPGLTVERRGSVLETMYNGQFGILGVEDACSGMRSTITLCALGVAVTFMSNRPAWQRIVMAGMCVPIATLCNIIRVLITCLLYIYVDPKYAGGTYHTTLGLLMILVAFGLFNGLGWLLNNLVVEEREEPGMVAA